MLLRQNSTLGGFILSGKTLNASIPWNFEFGYVSPISNVQVAGPQPESNTVIPWFNKSVTGAW